MDGCRIEHLRFPIGSLDGIPTVLTYFPHDAFGPNAILQSRATSGGRMLRVLSRARALSDPPSDSFRFYCGRGAPVWNNAGDTARIFNKSGEPVDTYTTVRPPGGAPPPPGTVVVQPRARTRAIVRRMWVDVARDWTTVFDVVDGDVITIEATGNAHFGGFAGQNGWSGPGGRVEDAAPYDGTWPAPGPPKCGLVVRIGETSSPIFVGDRGTVTVSGDGGPFTLFLGPNEDVWWDNNGAFDCVAVLYR